LSPDFGNSKEGERERFRRISKQVSNILKTLKRFAKL
jgi:hypothetical protein